MYPSLRKRHFDLYRYNVNSVVCVLVTEHPLALILLLLQLRRFDLSLREKINMFVPFIPSIHFLLDLYSLPFCVLFSLKIPPFGSENPFFLCFTQLYEFYVLENGHFIMSKCKNVTVIIIQDLSLIAALSNTRYTDLMSTPLNITFWNQAISLPLPILLGTNLLRPCSKQHCCGMRIHPKCDNCLSMLVTVVKLSIVLQSIWIFNRNHFLYCFTDYLCSAWIKVLYAYRCWKMTDMMQTNLAQT